MTPHPGKQTVTLPILLNLSQSKGNQTLKFGQVMEYNQKIFFFLENHAENEAEASSRPLVSLKRFIIGKSK